MISFFVALAALASSASAKEIKFKALSLSQPEIEIGFKNSKGKIDVFTVYAHALSSEKTVTTKERKIVLLTAERNSSGKINWATYATADVPPDLDSVILILSGDASHPKATIVSDPPEKSQGGSLRFLNTCPYSVGINLPGFKKILASGTETFCKPSLSHETYGQGQLFTSNDSSGWRPAGGMRWLQLNDVRTLWFIAPDPNNFNLVTVHGIEESARSTLVSPALKINPKNAVSQTDR